MVKSYITFVESCTDPTELHTLSVELDELSDWYFDIGDFLTFYKLTALGFLADAKADRLENLWSGDVIAYGQNITEYWLHKAIAECK